ncbi:MAG: bifunctional glutamate N-acetyltransferase/amino-acid acetyltransferase ArgJ [Halieaceae bacterium]|nr:bifunctional glutamate N-acetyltransferase/amino-acid acetyltransferase ArgJ [Halieaceae bacterium]
MRSESHCVSGIRLNAVSAGIKTTGRPDLVLMEIAAGATTAGCFTRNAFCAAPVQVAREHLSRFAPRYLLINAGNANAGTGEQGLADARQCCAEVAALTGVAVEQVLPFSTGVIGEYLPVNKIKAVLGAACDGLNPDRWPAAAEAIMTTDTQAKFCSRKIQLEGDACTVSGFAKGAGMIKPNMATMLAFLATDAAVEQKLLCQLWTEVVEHSFNRISVDGDTSTNDAAILVASAGLGNAPLVDTQHPDYASFKQAVFEVALELAQWLVRDGEGATKFVTLQVLEGRSEEECLEVAYTIAHSPLVKTALFASNPNWGRLLMAIGKADVEALDVGAVSVRLNNVGIVEQGCRAAQYTEQQGVAAMAPTDITIEVRLGRGSAGATVWTSDLSYEYVRINAEYRT